MDKRDKHERTIKKSDERPFRIRVPGFITDDEIGLGDVIKGVTSRVGIRQCGGCRNRAEILNNWVVFKR
jgi:hypothetical protein